MDDIKLRDLSHIPESELTEEERRELKRRFEEFVGRLRKEGDLSTAEEAEETPKRVQRWDPRSLSRRH